MNNFHQLCDTLFGIFDLKEAKRTWYHISPKDFGDVVKFQPRIPWSATPGEPKVPRICVAPDLAGCFLADVLNLNKADKTVFIYSTEAEAIAARDVFDAEVTEEHWILRTAIFYKVGEITLGEIPSSIRELTWLDEQGNYLPEQHKVAKQAFTKWFQENPILEPAMAEAEEPDTDVEDIPTVPAPGNFHQYTNKRTR